MNAIDFLTKEHNQVRRMVKDISDDSHRFKTKLKLFDSLAQELIRHEDMEHEIWYPCFNGRLPDTVKHLLTEERKAEQAIKKQSEFKTQEAWEKHFNELAEDIEHHACEEEQELFPEVEKILSEHKLNEIGLKMHKFKEKHS